MKIYNMEKNEWRGKGFKRGDTWRSTKVYRCKICHTKTNEWIMGGYPGMGPRLLCPADGTKEHEEIESLLEDYVDLNKKIKKYLKIFKHLKGCDFKKTIKMIENLSTERDLLKEAIKLSRKKISGKFDNIEGLGSKHDVEDYYPTSRVSRF